MGGLIINYGALALLGIFVFCCVLYLAGPKDKPRCPSDSRCWCEAFGSTETDCYCVTFEDGDS